MLLLREPERKNPSVLQRLRSAFVELGAVVLPVLVAAAMVLSYLVG